MKNKLVKAISKVQDEKLLEDVYHFLNSHLQANEYELTNEDKVDLDERMAR
ncbi:MAG: hypothetical protein M3R17_19995 [Bacteroidota bacterium]|nr:hypothetical protein [Bacteroidota bacterium]